MTLFLTLTMLAISVIGPRRLWWSLIAWTKRLPDMNEPSDSYYQVTRGVATVLAFVGLIASLVTYCAPPESERDTHVAVVFASTDLSNATD